MLSCKDVCSKVSESLDRKLSLWDRFWVKMHLLMCNACRRMARQMELLRGASRHYLSAEEGHPGQGALSKEAGTRILKRLRNAKYDHHDSK